MFETYFVLTIIIAFAAYDLFRKWKQNMTVVEAQYALANEKFLQNRIKLLEEMQRKDQEHIAFQEKHLEMRRQMIDLFIEKDQGNITEDQFRDELQKAFNILGLGEPT